MRDFEYKLKWREERRISLEKEKEKVRRERKWARERKIPKRILVIGIGHLVVNLVVTASGSNHDSNGETK